MKLRITYLVGNLDNASVRHRVDAYVPCLQQAGWDVRKVKIPPPRSIFRRLLLFRSLRQSDVVVLFKKMLCPWQMALLRRCAKRLVFDFDDAILYNDTGRNGYRNPRRARRFPVVCRRADTVIVGNQYLASLARDYGALPIIVPTCIDDALLSPGEPCDRHDPVVLGWIGSRATVKYLQELVPVLEALHRRNPGRFILRVICDTFPNSADLVIERKMWSRADELQNLRSLDVGIMPLPDNLWTRGKCGFKLMQYMAVGLPVVGSPVGVNVEIIRDGHNGFLAGSPDEWIEKLERLIHDPDLRRSIGLAGYESLKGRYRLSDWTQKYCEIISGT